MDELINLDWITLFDYMNLTSKSIMYKKINNFYESFYPLKYKKNQKKPVELKKIYREGFLGEMCRYMTKIIYVFQLFFASERWMWKQVQILDQIRLSQFYCEMQIQNIQDTIQIEHLANLIMQLSKRLSGKQQQQDQKTFLQMKMFSGLLRILDFMNWFYFYYNEIGDKKVLQKLYQTFAKITFNTCTKNKSEVKLYPEIGEILIQLMKFLHQEKKNQPVTYSQRLRKFFTSICTKQKNIVVQLTNSDVVHHLTSLGYEIPKDLVQNYIRSQQQINTIISQEENVIQPILLNQHLRGTKRWNQKAVEQLINLTVQKQIKQPYKLLMNQEFKKSKNFPLFEIE